MSDVDEMSVADLNVASHSVKKPSSTKPEHRLIAMLILRLYLLLAY